MKAEGTVSKQNCHRHNLVEQTFPEDLGVPCDDYKGNRNDFHSMAEIPRECILETFLLKQTDSAVGFFLLSTQLLITMNWSTITFRTSYSKHVSKRDKISRTEQTRGNTVVLSEFISFRTVIKKKDYFKWKYAS